MKRNGLFLIIIIVLFTVLVFTKFTVKKNAGSATEDIYSGYYTTNEKLALETALVEAPKNECILMPFLIYFHKAEDDLNKYITKESSSPGSWAESMYWLCEDTSTRDYMYLKYRNVYQKYLIKVYPSQSYEFFQKLKEFNIFDLDYRIPVNTLMRSTHGLESSIFPFNLKQIDYISISSPYTAVVDITEKNKIAINAYVNWLDSKYKTELLKHPVDKWPED